MTQTADIAALSAHRIFRTDHYAASAGEKALRSLALGPGYYFNSVPRYWMERRSKAVHDFDAEVLWNPLHEFGFLTTEMKPLPPGMPQILDDLVAHGLTVTLKPARFLSICAEWWAATAAGPSCVIECGSYEGATGIALALLAHRTGRDQQIHLFDVFGSTNILEFKPVDGPRQHNEFVIAEDQPRRLREIAQKLGIGGRLHLHVGLFSETFPSFDAGGYLLRFVHIDANLYESTKEAVAFVRPRLVPKAVVVFDDYHGITDLGARLAVDEGFGLESRRIRRLSGTSAVLDIL